MKLELSYEKIRQMIDKNRSALNFLVLILLFSTCSNNDSSELSLDEISSDDEIIPDNNCVNNDIEDLSDEVRTNIRRTKQKLADLEQSRDQLSKDLKEVRALPSIIKGIQKMKEEAAKAAAEDD